MATTSELINQAINLLELALAQTDKPRVKPSDTPNPGPSMPNSGNWLIDSMRDSNPSGANAPSAPNAPAGDGTDFPASQPGKFVVQWFNAGDERVFSTTGGQLRGEIIQASTNTVDTAHVRLWFTKDGIPIPGSEYRGLFINGVMSTPEVQADGVLQFHVIVEDKSGNLHVMVPR